MQCPICLADFYRPPHLTLSPHPLQGMFRETCLSLRKRGQIHLSILPTWVPDPQGRSVCNAKELLPELFQGGCLRDSARRTVKMVPLVTLQLTVETGCVTMLSLTLHHMEKSHPSAQNCAEFYCETCASYHRKFGFSRDHKLRPAAEVDEKALKAALNQTKIPYCDQHPEAKLHLYCDTCQVPVCAACCMLTHQQHKYRELAAMGQECQDKLTRHSKTATGHIITLDKRREELEACQTNIQRDATKACQEVQQAADELRSLVTKREQHLIQQIREEEKTALLEVKAACKEIELNKATMQSLQSYIQALQVSGNITDQVVHTPGVQEQLHQQLAAPLRAVSWTASFKKETNSVAVLDAMLGTVSTESSVVTTKPVAAGGSAMDVVQMKLGAPLSTLKCPFSDSCSRSCCSGRLCVCHWVVVTVASGYTTQPQTHPRYTHWKVSVMSGMTVIHKGTDSTLVITDKNKKLHFVTFNQNTLDITTHTVKDITFSTTSHQHPPSDWATCHSRQDTNKAIVTCDTQGNTQNSIKVQTDVGYMPCAVATDDGFVILDYSKKAECTGWTVRAESHTHMARVMVKVSRNPWHMVRGSQGHLVVADTDNHRLHLVDASGHLSCYLLTQSDGIQYPWLCVAGWDHITALCGTWAWWW